MKKNMLKWRNWITLNASWVILSNMVVNTNLKIFFVMADTNLKECDIITFIFNEKTWRLNLLICMHEDVIL